MRTSYPHTHVPHITDNWTKINWVGHLKFSHGCPSDVGWGVDDVTIIATAKSIHDQLHDQSHNESVNYYVECNRPDEYTWHRFPGGYKTEAEADQWIWDSSKVLNDNQFRIVKVTEEIL